MTNGQGEEEKKYDWTKILDEDGNLKTKDSEKEPPTPKVVEPEDIKVEKGKSPTESPVVEWNKIDIKVELPKPEFVESEDVKNNDAENEKEGLSEEAREHILKNCKKEIIMPVIINTLNAMKDSGGSIREEAVSITKDNAITLENIQKLSENNLIAERSKDIDNNEYLVIITAIVTTAIEDKVIGKDFIENYDAQVKNIENLIAEGSEGKKSLKYFRRLVEINMDAEK